ncbi:MAG: DUF695 domain-containing protein [Bacteroidota bacterium]|nr:DUF695 domain-containing protein [Bacteroidota bacterium]
MKLTDKWFSAISEDENGKLVIVTGRDDIMDFVKSGKFKERAEIYWKYEGDGQGMPSEELSEQMEQVEEALRKSMEKDKLAILTGVYTGGGQKTWVFICRTVRVFGERLNEVLSSFDLLPIEIYTENDPDCEEYLDMLEMRSWGGDDDDED